MSAYMQAGIIIFSYFTLFFMIATVIKNNSIVDIGWGMGFVVVSWIVAVLQKNLGFAQLSLLLLVTLWGIRLSYHIFK